MRWSWRVGALFGIDVYVHATFFLLLGWIVLSHFAQGHSLSLALEGLALVLAVFGVVVLHELGHALTARRFGIRTRDITLLPIGGVASLERLPEKPGQELLVAIAGPLVNLVLALIFGALALVYGAPADAESVRVVGGSFLTKLMWINVSLAGFNLLPAFPMDGGRILRALLAFRLDYARATDLAARLGQGMALLFGVLGFLFNPMLVLIAFFVWMGAQQESSLVRFQAVLRGIPIQSAMITDFRTLSRADPLSRAAELIIAGFQHDFPVIEEGRIVGVLTRGDLVRGLAQGGQDLPVGQVMHREFETVDPKEMLEGAIPQLRDRDSPSVIVLKDDRVVGMLTLENIGELVMMESARRKAAA